MLDRDVARDVLHRPRAVERDDRDDVLEAIGPELLEHVADTRAFELEHADRLAARQQLVSAAIVERQIFEVECHPAGGQQIARAGEDRQGLEPEEVELHEPGELDPFHVELGDRDVGARVAVERDKLAERAVADDDAGRMRRGVPVEPFELQGDRHQPRHGLVRVALLLQMPARRRSPPRG